MYKSVRTIVAFIAAISAFIVPSQDPVSAASISTVTVELSSASRIKESTPLLLGVNTDWPQSANSPVLRNSHATEPSPDYAALFGKYGFTIYNSRQGGDSSNKFDWMASLGAPAERTDSTHTQSYGIVEWIKGAQSVNPDTALTYVINLSDPPEKNANLIRFLTLMPEDDRATDPQTGVNWAQRRIDLGIADPPNIIAFELGNESYSAYGVTNWTKPDKEETIAYAANYVEKCKPVIDAVRAVNPDVKLSAVSNSGAEDYSVSDLPDALNPSKQRVRWWNQTVIEALRDYNGGINYVTHHDYYRDTDKNYTARSENIYSRISDYFGGRDIQILVTEHNLLDLLSASAATEERQARSAELSSLGRALYIAEFLNTAYNHPLIYSANHHGIWEVDNNTMWAVVRTFTENGKAYLTAPGAVLALMSEAVGGSVVKTTVSNNVDNAIITSAHLKEDGRLDLVLLSRKATDDITVNINLQNGDQAYRLQSVSTLSGSKDSKNTPQTPEAAVIHRTLIEEQSTIKTYTIAPNSMSVLHLVPTDISASTDSVGQISVQKTRQDLRITDKLYHADGLYDTPAGVLLLKPGADPESFDPSDIVGAGQTRICADIAYFTLPLPEELAGGMYTVVVGGESFRHTAKAYLSGIVDANLSLEIKNADPEQIDVNGQMYNSVSNSDYRIEASLAGSEFPPRTLLGVSVSYGNADTVGSYTDADRQRIVYLDEVTASSQSGLFSISMPKESLSGLYTLRVSANIDGRTAFAEKTFYFVKPDELVQITAPPYDENGRDAMVEFDSPPQKIFVPIRRLSDAVTDISVLLAGYNNEGVLISLASAPLKLQDDDVHTAELSCRMDSAAYFKLFIWTEDTIKPQTQTYYIRQ